MRSFRRLIRVSAAALTLALGAASVQAGAPSSPSQLSTLSALSVVTVPLAFSEGVTTLSVQGVRALGDVLELSVKGAGQASEFSIRVPAAMAGGLSVAAGTLIEVSADAVGHLLRIGGKIIGFIPNEVGRSLLRHAPVGHGDEHRLQQTGRSM